MTGTSPNLWRRQHRTSNCCGSKKSGSVRRIEELSQTNSTVGNANRPGLIHAEATPGPRALEAGKIRPTVFRSGGRS